MFSSLLNFRPVGGKLFSECDSADEANRLNLKIYRSARLDNISRDDLKKLRTDLDIKCVIDLRDYKSEYKEHVGSKIIDENGIEILDVDTMAMQKSGKSLWLRNHGPTSKKSSDVRHLMVNLLGKVFAFNLIMGNLLPLWKRIYAAVLAVFYLVFRLKWIVHFIKHEVEINPLIEIYKALIDCSGAQITFALRQMSEPQNLPCVICCHAGKDRTGILSALLLHLTGVSIDKIADDYSHSSVGLPSTHRELQIYPDHIRLAPRQTMHQLFDHIERKYGSVTSYLAAHGFSVADQQRLKQAAVAR